ncbi:MAG: hypothetical protein EBT91_10235 [Rhodobacteraceae bacterium]|jgi:hypothetical protein|nr:hypothetical protein [Paracoccaceae bacterium]
MRFIVAGVVALSAALSWSGTAFAQESSNRVQASTDWSVFVESNPKECWAVSAPKETVNTRDGNVVSVRRGDILLFVFYRPGEGVNGQLAFTGGYPFAGGSTVDLDVDGTKYALFTEGEWAWAAKPEDDATIVAAMKKGSSATLVARSGRGTVTTDKFSLSGFTAAVTEAENRCK